MRSQGARSKAKWYIDSFGLGGGGSAGAEPPSAAGPPPLPAEPPKAPEAVKENAPPNRQRSAQAPSAAGPPPKPTKGPASREAREAAAVRAGAGPIPSTVSAQPPPRPAPSAVPGRLPAAAEAALAAALPAPAPGAPPGPSPPPPPAAGAAAPPALGRQERPRQAARPDAPVGEELLRRRADAQRREDAEQLRRKLAREEERRAAAEARVEELQAAPEPRVEEDPAFRALQQRFQELQSQQVAQQRLHYIECAKQWKGQDGGAAADGVTQVLQAAKELAEQLQATIDANKRRHSDARRGKSADRDAELRALREELADCCERERALEAEAANAVAALDLLGAQALEQCTVNPAANSRAEEELRKMREHCRALQERAEHSDVAKLKAAKFAIDLETQVTSLSEELDECQDRLRAAEASAASQTKVADGWRAELGDARNALEAAIAREVELKEGMASISARMDEYARSSQAAQESEATSQMRCIALEQQVAGMESELNRCRESGRSLSDEVSAKDCVVAQLEAELEVARKKFEALQREVQEGSASRAAAAVVEDARIVELEAELEGASKKVVELEAQVRAESSATATRDEDLARLREKVAEATSSLQAARQAELQGKEEVVALKAELAKATTAMAELAQAHEAELARLRVSTEEAAQSREDQVAKSAAAAEEAARVREAEAAAEASAKAAVAAEAALAGARAEVARLSSELGEAQESARQRVLELEGHSAGLEAEIEVLRTRMDEDMAGAAARAGEERASLRAQLDLARGEAEAAAGAAEAQEGELCELRRRLADSEERAAEAQQQAAEAEERALGAARERDRSAAQRIARLEEELAAADIKVQEAAAAAAIEEGEALRMKAEVEELREALSASRAGTAALERQAEALEQDLHEASARARAAADSCEQAQSLSAALESERAKLKEARAEARRWEESHGASVAQVSWLRRETEEFRSKAKELEAELARETEVIEDLRSHEAQLQRELTSARDALEASREDREAEAAQMQAQVADARLRLDEAQAERIRCGAHAEALEQQLVRARAKQEETVSSARGGAVARRWSVFSEAIAQLALRRAVSGPEAVALRSARRSRSKAAVRFAAMAGRLGEVVKACALADALRVARREDAEAASCRVVRLQEDLRAVTAEEALAREAAEVAKAERDEARRALEGVEAVGSEELATRVTELSATAASAEARAGELAAELEAIHREAQRKLAEEETLRMLVEDLNGCDRECEDLRLRSRELLTSVQHFKEENELLAVENRSLKDAVSLFEGDLEDLADRHAQLMSHTNKKQKIRYTIKLKEECSQLRAELAKARSRLAQLEGARRCEGLFVSAFSAANDGKRRGSLSCSPSQQCLSPLAPVASSAGPQVRSALFAGPALLTASPDLAAPRTTPRRPPNAAARRPAEAGAERAAQAMRRCRLQERALERISIDYQHLMALVERAVARDAEAGRGAGGLAEVLRRLRGDLAAAARHGAREAEDEAEAAAGSPALGASPASLHGGEAPFPCGRLFAERPRAAPAAAFGSVCGPRSCPAAQSRSVEVVMERDLAPRPRPMSEDRAMARVSALSLDAEPRDGDASTQRCFARTVVASWLLTQGLVAYHYIVAFFGSNAASAQRISAPDVWSWLLIPAALTLFWYCRKRPDTLTASSGQNLKFGSGLIVVLCSLFHWIEWYNEQALIPTASAKKSAAAAAMSAYARLTK